MRSNLPVFTTIPVNARARLDAANTARDGSGTITELYTAPTLGAMITKIRFISAQASAGVSSAMVGRVFISDTNGTNWRLYDEVALATVTPSGTVVGQKADITYVDGLQLQGGQKIGVTKSVHAGAGDQYDVFAHGGEYEVQPA